MQLIIYKQYNIQYYYNSFRAPHIGKKEIWMPVSKNPKDPLRFVKITQEQTFEPTEQLNHGNYLFWKSLPLTEFYENETNTDEENKIHIEL